VTAVDDYLEAQDDEHRAALARICDIVMETVGDVEEGTSYGMPAFKYRKRPLFGFAVAKTHLSVFPFSPTIIDATRDRLRAFDVSKGTVRFSLERQVPKKLIVDMLRLRKDEIEGILDKRR
jgi:uncharacterized protein YdhG (YjbR/CyaY superfamily)